MNFLQFRNLVQTAYDSSDPARFAREQKEADWAQAYNSNGSDEKIERILDAIWSMRDNPVKAIKKATGHTNQSLHDTYGPPIRSIENWSSGSHPCAPYAAIWLAYIAFTDSNII